MILLVVIAVVIRYMRRIPQTKDCRREPGARLVRRASLAVRAVLVLYFFATCSGDRVEITGLDARTTKWRGSVTVV